jgi:NAD(P)-dependent dehydrogenase (short-subunit alcohol dehydrogenase family)
MSTSPRIAVVTGGSSGIGKGICIHLAGLGWDIAATYGHNHDGAKATAAAVEGAGRRALVEQCDVGYREQVAGFFEKLVRELGGPPRLVVNNAGTQAWGPLLEHTEEDWDRVIRTNLKGTFLCTQIGAALMVEHGVKGSIVNIGSGCNKVPFPRLVSYTASKGGIEMFTRSAAIELGRHGIRVNCVAPGAIEIERTKLEAPDYAETWGKQAPLGRVGFPDDVAKAVAYLASDDAEFVTAQTIWIDGGAFSLPSWPYQDQL